MSASSLPGQGPAIGVRARSACGFPALRGERAWARLVPAVVEAVVVGPVHPRAVVGDRDGPERQAREE
jgi:hypothetical protein